jgi:hypothetical protein
VVAKAVIARRNVWVAYGNAPMSEAELDAIVSTAHATWWLTGATIVLAVVTARCMRAQSRDTRTTVQLDILLRLADKWDAPALRQARHQAATHWCNVNQVLPRPADQILDFFETLGYMLRHSHVDTHMAHNEFSAYVVAWWHVFQQHVSDTRKHLDDPTIWLNAEWMAKKLNQVDARSRNILRTEVLMTDAEAKKFLVNECM